MDKSRITPQQRMIVGIAATEGRISMDTIMTHIYSDPRSAERAVKRLCKLGILVADFGWFVYAGVKKEQRTMGEVVDVRER